MSLYEEVVGLLLENSDEKYRAFHSKLLKNDRIRVIGVRTPVLRRIAKAYFPEREKIFAFPDEYYEIGFIKFALLGGLTYGELIPALQASLPLLDNWATCDSFSNDEIPAHKGEFLGEIEGWLKSEREFTRRFALTMLLRYYSSEREYLDVIFRAAEESGEEYYAMMAAAWLLAEVLVTFFDEGYEFLKKNTLPAKTHNKAIQKAAESFRITDEQKRALKSLRRKMSKKD